MAWKASYVNLSGNVRGHLTKLLIGMALRFSSDTKRSFGITLFGEPIQIPLALLSNGHRWHSRWRSFHERRSQRPAGRTFLVVCGPSWRIQRCRLLAPHPKPWGTLDYCTSRSVSAFQSCASILRPSPRYTSCFVMWFLVPLSSRHNSRRYGEAVGYVRNGPCIAATSGIPRLLGMLPCRVRDRWLIRLSPHFFCNSALLL